MGKYNHIFDSEQITEESLSPEEGVAATAVLAAFADAEGSSVEATALAGILSGIELFQDYSKDDLQAMLEKIAGIADNDGLGALFNAALESITEELIPTAFAAGAAIVMIDGAVPDEESEFISELQLALDLSDEDAVEIIDAVVAGFQEAEAENETGDEEEEYAEDEEEE